MEVVFSRSKSLRQWLVVGHKSNSHTILINQTLPQMVCQCPIRNLTTATNNKHAKLTSARVLMSSILKPATALIRLNRISLNILSHFKVMMEDNKFHLGRWICRVTPSSHSIDMVHIQHQNLQHISHPSEACGGGKSRRREGERGHTMRDSAWPRS